MSTVLKIVKYTIYDIVRSKVILSYAVFLFVVSMSLLMLDTDPSRGLSSIMSVMLFIVPLVSIVFSTIFIYNNYEFIELLVTQPIRRNHILMANYLGVAASLISAYFVGIAVPLLMYSTGSQGLYVILVGIMLTFIFTSLAFLGAVISRDKARGIGIALLLWFFFSVIYDGLLIGLLFLFSDYPLEKAALLITVFNPIDLGRVSMMMKMDISALMGYTGAVYRDFFGTGMGMIYTFVLLVLWATLPLVAAARIFRKKNL